MNYDQASTKSTYPKHHIGCRDKRIAAQKGSWRMLMRDETNLEQLTDDLLAALRDTIQPPYVSVCLRPPKNK
jgi:hypothetical protein